MVAKKFLGGKTQEGKELWNTAVEAEVAALRGTTKMHVAKEVEAVAQIEDIKMMVITGIIIQEEIRERVGKTMVRVVAEVMIRIRTYIPFQHLFKIK